MADSTSVILKTLLDAASQKATDSGMKSVANSISSIEKANAKADAKAEALSKKSISRIKQETKVQEEHSKAVIRSLEDQAKYFEEAQNRHLALMKTLYSQPAKSSGRQVTPEEIAETNRLLQQRAEKEAQIAKEKSAAIQGINNEESKNVEFQKEAEKARQRALKFAEEEEAAEREINRLASQRKEERRAEEEQRRQILEVEKEIKAQYAEQRKEVERLRKTSEMIGGFGRASLVSGTAILGGLFGLAQKEANRQRDKDIITPLTQRWLDANKRIELSFNRIGRVAQQAIIPYLEEAASLASKFSKFIEAHPGTLEAAAKAGGILVGIGVIATALSKGIRIVADLKYVAANAQFDSATLRFERSVAAYLSGAKFTPSAGGATGLAGKAASTLGAVTLIASSVIIGAELGSMIGNAIAKKIHGEGYQEQGINDALMTLTRIFKLPWVALAEGIEKLGFGELSEKILKTVSATDKFTSEILGLSEASKDAEASIGDLSDELSDMKGFEIMRNLERENLEAEQKFVQERASIIQRANDSIEQSNAQLASAISRIRQNLSSILASLASAFSQENARAYAEFMQQQSQIVRDGEEEIRRIREDAQEALRKLEEDYTEQRDELTRSRDALGLVKAERDYEKQKKEIERNRDKEIAESRRQTAQKLADLRQSYERERAERLAKYEQDVADAKAQAAREIAQEQAANAERIQEIQRQKDIELAELAKAYYEERRQRILAAYDQIRDLGDALNAERAMRATYYSVILAEANSFMAAYASALTPRSGSGGIPTRQGGGYSAGQGLHYLHEDEFVMRPSTTKAAESLIGGRLTNESLLAGLMRGTQNNVVLNDSRRFDSGLTLADKQWIRAENERYVGMVLLNIGKKGVVT